MKNENISSLKINDLPQTGPSNKESQLNFCPKVTYPSSVVRWHYFKK